MRYATTLTAALAALGLVGGEAKANCPELDMVQGWYARYLHRPVDPLGEEVWVGQLRGGAPAAQVESQILGSEEYYRQNGGCPEKFVEGLYRDVLGRCGSPAEIHDWAARLVQF